ncbi:MAG TPA: hypothetical protein VGF55_27675 [Gemmataceae bacterium]|jgi:hypothetical protein
MTMTRAAGLAALLTLAIGPAVRAQAPGQPPGSPFGGPARASSPTFSPYLNLLRPGNQAVNYYGLVRPQFEFRSGLDQLQQQYGTLSREVNAPNQAGPTELPATGHAVSFMNTRGYFGGLGANRGGGRPGMVAPAAGATGIAAPRVAAPTAPTAGGR